MARLRDMPRSRIGRAAPLAIAFSGLTLLGAAAGGVASLDSSLVAATAAQQQQQQQRQTQLVDYAPPRSCPDRGGDASTDHRWRS